MEGNWITDGLFEFGQLFSNYSLKKDRKTGKRIFKDRKAHERSFINLVNNFVSENVRTKGDPKAAKCFLAVSI